MLRQCLDADASPQDFLVAFLLKTGKLSCAHAVLGSPTILHSYMLLSANWLERELWVHPFCCEAATKGEFFLMYPDLRKYPAKFFRTYHMSIRQFDNLLHLLRPVISKQINNYCESISAEERLVITLR